MAGHRTMEHAPPRGSERSSRRMEKPESRTEERRVTRSEPGFLTSAYPLTVMRRFVEDVDRMFETFGLPRGLSSFDPARAWSSGGSLWPQVETFERDGQFIVRADLPGMKKDDVRVQVESDSVTIEGERRHEREEKDRSGGHFSERSYGRFHRTIPLPDYVKADEAKARFHDGVLEVTMPSTSPPKRRRNIEIH